MKAIRARGRVPILVGGTQLYYRALLQGLDDMPASDPAVRAAIEREASERGWPALHTELSRVDPELAARLHPNHSQRIGRGLEIWRMTGKPLSAWQQGDAGPAVDGPVVACAICPEPRALLHQRIEQRFDAMLEQGLVDEVRALHARADLTADLPAIRAVGYRQIWAYLDGEVDLAQARSMGIAATRQLAKRQLTWLRGWPELTWLLTNASGELQGMRSNCTADNAERWMPLRAAIEASGGVVGPDLARNETVLGFFAGIMRNSIAPRPI